MPQLDRFSFISQIFWLLVIFFSFHVILLRFILPHIGRILKARQIVIDELVQEQQDLEKEAAKAIANYKFIIVNWGTFLYKYSVKINAVAEDIRLQQEGYATISKDMNDFNELFVETLVSIYIKKAVIKFLL